jgi:hypothetical protein
MTLLIASLTAPSTSRPSITKDILELCEFDRKILLIIARLSTFEVTANLVKKRAKMKRPAV